MKKVTFTADGSTEISSRSAAQVRSGSPLRKRPKLLFLCQTLPFPPDGGVTIRTYNILRLLARNFDVTALCFYRTATKTAPEQVEASVEALKEIAEVSAFPIPQEHSRGRLLWDHARSVTRNRVYTAYAYESEDFRSALVELLETRKFDLVHMDSLDLSPYLPLIDNIPVVCVHHNVESELLRRRAAVEESWWKGVYMERQAKLMTHEEQRWCGRVALNVTVSSADRDLLQQRIPEGEFVVVPNGVDTTTFQPGPGNDEGIVFVGGTTWFPNRDGLNFFSTEILPLLREGAESALIRWVGRASEAEKQHFSYPGGIEVTGYVDDIRPYVHAAACYIVPLRVGGGTRLKVLDAWAMGKAVVSTSIGCEGLEARDGKNILIRDTPETFAEAVRAVLSDSELRRRLGAAARQTAEQIYAWEVIGDDMTRKYLGLINLVEHEV